ncbi:aminodeoxychorismate lyase [Coprinopsis cinerea okayama7|uniref:Aminodeoxychorismate lyase n=1 Tax=Coprinopsis cinerea (strain Okayama-7 / 130 / ATCC MYA-4618 / FGSC 9003) TaxID=240176 RepID=D6RK48_COPC7|nr:aminodeoxychorismate lyase [Coprinopsis cinerea okayama7\|eukprot:XP_002912178.1 aminodeoxychorismate lyase [Coprinopsis cinerea okayama7\
MQTQHAEAGYDLLTTTRHDPALTRFAWNNDRDAQPSPFFLLPYHHERLVEAAAKHGWNDITCRYEDFKSAVRAAINDPQMTFRVRILLSHTGSLQVTAVPMEQSFTDDPFSLSLSKPSIAVQNPLTVLLDKQPVAPSIFTSTKTTNRKVYDDARDRMGIPPLTTPAGRTCDVLLYNSDQMIMETSIFNVAFFRSGQWVTPAAATGCLLGVARRWLLEHNRITEDTAHSLTIGSIVDGEYVLLFNGLQGCRMGRCTVAQ